MYLSIHPHVQQVPMYISIVRVKRTLGDQILLSENGLIEGFTKNIGNSLQLSFNEQIFMQEICKTWLELHQEIKYMIHNSDMLYINESEGSTEQNIKDETFRSKKSTKVKVPMSNSLKPVLSKNLLLQFHIKSSNLKSFVEDTQTYQANLACRQYAGRQYFVLSLEQAVKEYEARTKLQRSYRSRCQ